MNLFIIKYAILIGAILSSTALVAGPLNPQQLFSEPAANDSGGITADAVYQFGSDTLYKELDKPGNEYMKANMEGYSRELVPTEQLQQTFESRWARAVLFYGNGYGESTGSLLEMVTIPQIQNATEKKRACDHFRLAKEDLRSSESYFMAAKASSSAGSASGFTIGMVIPRVSRISTDAEDAEISCMKAVLADRNGDKNGFQKNLDDAKASITEMKRLNAELKVLSDDFP
jgi:hypothetical protein